jgi:hypothetical protein
VVPHRGTNWAALWLTAQIGRDAVLSESYGRGYLGVAQPHIYGVHNWFIDYKSNGTTNPYCTKSIVRNLMTLQY